MGFIPVMDYWSNTRSQHNNGPVDPAAGSNAAGNPRVRGSQVQEMCAADCEAEFFADDQPVLGWKAKCLSVYELPIFSGRFGTIALGGFCNHNCH